jgi:hypothetical protein
MFRSPGGDSSSEKGGHPARKGEDTARIEIVRINVLVEPKNVFFIG